MTSYVNQQVFRQIRVAAMALLAASFVVAQVAVPMVQAGNRIPHPGIETYLTVDQTTGAVVTSEGAKRKTLKTIRMNSTAYTSTVEECDSDPFITADGSDVRDGIVATNVLPFGTKVRLPTVFGDKVFVVHDRMNARYSYRIDIWMSDRNTAIKYGLKRNIPIEVIEWGDNKTQWAARAEKMKQERLAKQRAKLVAVGK